MTKPYRLHSLGRIAAYKLYQHYLADHDDDKLSASDLQGRFSDPVSRNLLTSSLEWLREHRLVSRHGDRENGGHKYKLTSEGIILVERSLSRRDSDIAYFAKKGDSALDEVAGIDSVWISPDERPDSDQWSPLAIDRDDPEFVAVLGALESALTKIKGDNGYSANEPRERDGIVQTLEEGIDWLKERAPTKAQLWTLVLKPLRWVATKFANSVIGEAATEAAKRFWDWLSKQ